MYLFNNFFVSLKKIKLKKLKRNFFFKFCKAARLKRNKSTFSNKKKIFLKRLLIKTSNVKYFFGRETFVINHFKKVLTVK